MYLLQVPLGILEVEKFQGGGGGGGIEIISGGVAIFFRDGVRFLRGELRFFREGLKFFFLGGGVRNFRGVEKH